MTTWAEEKSPLRLSDIAYLASSVSGSKSQQRHCKEQVSPASAGNHISVLAILYEHVHTHAHMHVPTCTHAHTH